MQHSYLEEISHNTIKKIVIGLVICLGFFIGLHLAKSVENEVEPATAAINQKLSERTVPEATPLPFAELTIPYLREKTYESALGELTKSRETSTYTAYRTSYTSDSLKVNGLLTQPKGDKPAEGWPAVVFVHGYIPPKQYKTEGQYVAFVDYLARNGFVVFKIDLRGHDASEGAASGAYYSSDYISDVLHAYSALQNSNFVNPQAIGLWGHSMAGNVTMRSFAVKPEIPAVVIWAGAVYSYADFQVYGISDASYQPQQNDPERQKKRRQLFEAHGEFSPDSPFWQQVAPTNYLNDLQGAIQIHHAVNDTVVDVGYSRNLNALLNNTGIVHELYEYPSGGHNITGESFNQAMQRTVIFYKQHLY
jgi:dipeptidyl aminopeptidase/acylaminoacyl peptidase